VDISARKATMRRLVLARRARLTPDERAAHAIALVDNVLALEEVAQARAVLAFVAISTEVPTDALLRAVLDSGKTLLLPYVSDEGAMQAAAVASMEELEPGYRGIPEPSTKAPLSISEADAIVLPGVAFDERGGRLGYGGGFYDRFLDSAAGASRIGICFDVQMVEEVPMVEHDHRVDIVVTEARTIRCEQVRHA
jgi:5-formyltetrahydrofolate cyclo-ligase